MKILNLKNLLSGLMAVLAISIVITSCEQDNLISTVDTLDIATEEGFKNTTNNLRGAGNVHSCFGLNLVELINSYQTPDLVKSPTQTFTSLSALQNKINAQTDHNGAVYALAAGTYNGTLKIVDKRNLCIYTNPNNPATINATGKNFGIYAYNNAQGIDSNIEILNFRITGSKYHGIYIGSDDSPRYAPRGVWVAGNEVFDVARIVGGGITVRNAFEGATIKIESNEVYNISPGQGDRHTGEGIYIGEGKDVDDYSSNIHIIGNNLHDLIAEGIDVKRKSANILIEYNRINNINISSQGAIVLSLDPSKPDDTYDGEYIVRRNCISNVTTRRSDGNFIVVGNASTLIEENVMWNTVKHGIDVYNDCDGPNKNVNIQNNIIWGYTGEPIRENIGNGGGGLNNPCTVIRTTNIVQSNPVGSECQEDASVFVGPLTTYEGFAPATTGSSSLSWNPPTSISNGNNQVILDYSINQNGVVLVQIYNSGWQLIGEVFEYVSPGTSQLTLNLPANNPSPTNNHLQAKLLNSDWGDIGVPRLYQKTPRATPPPSSSCEILTNGNFDSNLSSWQSWNCNAYSSNGTANITSIITGANVWHVGFSQKGITLEQGKTYTLTFRARANSNRSINFKAGLSEAPWTAYFHETANISTSMQTYTHTFTMSSATNTNAKFDFFFGNHASNVYIENVSLKESNCGTTSTCEVLTNGGFDAGISDWGSWNCSAGSSGGVANITDISTGANPWHTGFNQVGFTVEQGKTYTVTFRARAATNRSIVVKTGMTGTPWTSYLYETVNLSTSMQTYTITFTMNYPTDTNSRFEFFFGTNSSNVYIDNVSMSSDC